MASMSAIRSKAAMVKAVGPMGFLALVKRRFVPHRSAFLDANLDLFRGHGLELGGPSRMFSAAGYTPVYPHARAIDNVNFAALTRWEGNIEAGATFRFRDGAAPGRQFVHEATELGAIADASYAFVLSSHMLEHSANPLAALREWNRVMTPGATLLLVLPHKDGTFDHRRPTTTLQHMVDDFDRQAAETDDTHLQEVLDLHDLARDPEQASAESFRAWVQGNAVNRGVHHHVFDSLSAAQLVAHAGYAILAVEPIVPESIAIFARKPAEGQPVDNTRFTTAEAGFLKKSLFKSDRARSAAPA